MLTFNNRPDEASLIYDSPSTIAVDAARGVVHAFMRNYVAVSPCVFA